MTEKTLQPPTPRQEDVFFWNGVQQALGRALKRRQRTE